MRSPFTIPQRLRDRIRPRPAFSPGADAVLSWIRTIALDGDRFVIGTASGHGAYTFPFPSSSKTRPTPVVGSDSDPRVRFVLRIDGAGSPPGDTFKRILSVPGLDVFERDARRSPTHLRPLRFGLSPDEQTRLVRHARAAATHFVKGLPGPLLPTETGGEPARLAQRTTVGVALWTRGRLRGSVVVPPAPALRSVGQAAVWACRDARFERPTEADLAESVFEVALVHPPAFPLPPDEVLIGDAFADKAVFLSKGLRAGVYLPEIFNVARLRLRSDFMTRLAREKAKLTAVGPDTRVDLHEVTDVIEAADGSGGRWLDGPVVRAHAGRGPAFARQVGVAASAWLARLQREDGFWPLRVRPSTGVAEGVDPPRVAMTAHALAAFGVAYGVPSAVETAKRAVRWVSEARGSWDDGRASGLLTGCYLGNAAGVLGDEATLERAALGVKQGLERSNGELPVLVASQLVAFARGAGKGQPDLAGRVSAWTASLESRWSAARAGEAPVVLAEWAEVVVATDSRLGDEVRAWLVALQKANGAFPESTKSDFVYSRGTGKVFEVLAGGANKEAATRALGWLASMQYGADSLFFVPTEHRSRVLGGLRHDSFDPDAWIDAAGHLLLGLARLA